MSFNYHYFDNFYADLISLPNWVLTRRAELLMRRSVPQKEMNDRLVEKNIVFEKEFVILSHVNEEPLHQYLDFFIPSKLIAIEIDDSRHQDTTDIRQQNLDTHKNQWCLHHQIVLIRICSHLPTESKILKFNHFEMYKWSSIIADERFCLNHFQYGTGFGHRILDYNF